MTCVICRSQFCYTSFSGPAEPCDCGAELTRDNVDSWKVVELLRDRFARGEDIIDEHGDYITDDQEAQ